MRRMKKLPSHMDSPSSRASLGGKVSHYRSKQNIYSQGAPAYTLFYIQEGGVRLTTKSKQQPAAVTAILGVGDFFGELCLAGFPLRMSTAVALTASSVREIKKESMLRILRKKDKISHSFVSYLVSSIKKYQDHVAELLTSPAEQRLARVLLRLAHLDRRGPAAAGIPKLKRSSPGGNGRHYAFAHQFFHEPIQEARIHQLQRRDGSTQITAERPPAPLTISTHH